MIYDDGQRNYIRCDRCEMTYGGLPCNEYGPIDKMVARATIHGWHVDKTAGDFCATCFGVQGPYVPPSHVIHKLIGGVWSPPLSARAMAAVRMPA